METFKHVPSGIKTALLAIIVGLAFFLSADLSLRLSFPPDHISAFWAPNAFVLAALLLTDWRRWWAYFLVMTLPYAFGDLSTVYSIQRSALYYLANCTEVLIAALGLKHFLGNRLNFHELKGMALYLLIATILAPFASAFVASLATMNEPELEYWLVWRIWFLGDSLGLLVLTPFIVLWLSTTGSVIKHVSPLRRAECMVVMLGLFIVSFFSLGQDIETTRDFPFLLYTPIPLLLWAALRFDLRGISSAVLMVSFMAIWHAINGLGPFNTHDPANNVLSLQLFLFATTIPIMLLASVVTERKQRLVESRVSGQRFQLALAANQSEVWDLNLKTDILSFSRKWATDFGDESNRTEIDFSAWREYVHPEDRESIISDTIKCRDNPETIVENTHRMLNRDGSYRWMLSSAKVASFTEDGSPLLIIGTHKDITKQKQMEIELLEAEQRWSYALESNRDGVWDWNIEDGTVFYSKRWKTMLGYDESTIGNGLDEIQKRIHPDDKKRVSEDINKHFDGLNEFYESEHRVLTINGSYKWILNRGKVTSWNDDHKPTRMIGTYTDISERKENEYAVSQAHLIIESSPAIAFIWQAKEGWPVEYVSKNVIQLGYSSHELLSGETAYLSIIHPDDQERVISEVEYYTNNGALQFSHEYRVVSPDGHVHWIDDRTNIQRGKDGNVVQYEGVILDISDRIHATQSEQALGQMIHGSLYEVYVFDCETVKFLDVNEGACQNLGYSLSELLEMTPLDLKPEFTRETFTELLSPLTAGKDKLLTLTTVHKRKNGTTYPVQIRLQKLPYRDTEAFVAMVTDTSNEKLIEESLRSSAENFNAIAAGATEAIIILDENAAVSFWSHSAETIFGYKSAEALGNPLTDLIIQAEDVDAHNNGFRSFQKTGDGILFGKSIEVAARNKDGATLAIELSINKSTHHGKLTAIGVLRDITERKGAEQSLLRLDRAHRRLVEINKAIIFSQSEQSLLNRVCSTLCTTDGYILVWIGIAEKDENKTVHPVAHYGFDDGFISQLNITWGDSANEQDPTGAAIRTLRPVIARNIHTSPDFERWQASALKYGYESFAAIPMINDGEVFGAINIYSSHPDAFGPDTVKQLLELTRDVAFGLRTKRVIAHNVSQTEKLETSLIQMIDSIALTVEQRDPYTSGHMNRVAELSVAIARKLGLTENQIQGIGLGARIHDIGKIYIPAEILNRPGKLSSAEFQMIKSHSQVGFDIIKGIDFPWPVAEMVLQHHERLDGTGYPNGLKGEEIAYEAKILAVADVVEAITSHRPYRAALGLEFGLDILKEGRGTHYSPEVVDACLQVVTEDGFKFE